MFGKMRPDVTITMTVGNRAFFVDFFQNSIILTLISFPCTMVLGLLGAQT